MEVVHDASAMPELPNGSAITIGAYDGVHLGHRTVIAEIRRLAAELGCASVVVTFDRHPASVVRPDSAPRLITDPVQKLELLASTGVDYTLVVHFDEDRSLEPAEQFVRQVLVQALRTRVVVVGEDFHFGHRRRGDVALLSEMGAIHDFKVIGWGLVEVPGIAGPVSSTAIRKALTEGDIKRATALLGRMPEERGVVEHGDRRGRELGFPTANVAVPGDIVVPAEGVYAGWYERPNGDVHPTAISIGRRPTFYSDGINLVEAHLLDFSGDLYGEIGRVRIQAWLRGQVKYEGVESLCAQLYKDVENTRRELGIA